MRKPNPKSMGTVVTFGEVMLRLTPPGSLRIGQTDLLEMSFGGAEVNVAVALAQLGTPSAFVTTLPDNDIARACIARIRAAGVDTCGIRFGDGRMGSYFVERGGGARPASVTYDRSYSAIATAGPAVHGWPELLRDASVLHISGITPALSNYACDAAHRAFETAAELGVVRCMDVNYRAKLWDTHKAGETLAPILDKLDWLICNENHARMLFGVPGDLEDEDIARTLAQRHPNLRKVAITRRRGVDTDHDRWGATLLADGACVRSTVRTIKMVDRVGGGDSFAAGLIHALLHGQSNQDAVDFGAAALALKHTIVGDFANFRATEVEAMRNADTGIAVQR